jgi:type I restriction enzyme S subunit
MKYETVELGDVCEFTYGESLIETKRKHGKIPVYGSNGIVGWHNKAITRGSTIIIGRKGSIGKVHFSPVPCYPIDTTYYIDKTKIACDLRWLYYLLLELDLTNLNKSAAVPGLNRNDAYEKKITLPPLTQQKRIAAIAQKADRLRRTRRYALQLSNTYLQSVFLEMFGDPATNPLGWKTKCLGELGNGENAIVDGPFGSSVDTKIDYIPNGEIPVIRSKNIRPFGFITDDLKFMSREKFNLLIRSRVVPGDILLVKVGVNLGDVCIFTDVFKEAVLSTTGSCKITPNNNIVNTNYLACYLYFLKEQMRKISSESAQPFLNMTTIKATQAMGDAAEYLGTKAQQQDTEPIQLKLPGIE